MAGEGITMGAVLKSASCLALVMWLGLPLEAASQTRPSAQPVPAPDFPAWPQTSSLTASSIAPIISGARVRYQQMSGPAWQPGQTLNVDVRDDRARLGVFCGRQTGPTQINYNHRTPTPEDIVSARFENVACADRAAQGETGALVQFRDGSVWVGQVEIRRGEALPVRPRGDLQGALLTAGGTVLFSVGRGQYDSVLGPDEYRYNGWIHNDGTVLTRFATPNGLQNLEPLIARRQTDYYVYNSNRRRSPYRGPPVYFQRGPYSAVVILPGGGSLGGGYFPSAGFYLTQRVERLTNARNDVGFGPSRNLISLTSYRNEEQGYTITGEYQHDFACQAQPSPFSLQFNAPMTEDLPVTDGVVADWRCVRFEFTGNTRILTTRASVLGPPGDYFAPFGSIAIGRGPLLRDMVVATRRAQIVPARDPQHGLTTFQRRDLPHSYNDYALGTAADIQNTVFGDNDSSGVRQRFDAGLEAANAPVRGQQLAAREARRRRDQFFFDLAGAAAGAAQSYNQQREQQAAADQAYRARIAGYMERDAAARSALSGSNPRDRGSYTDRAARQAEQNRIVAEESAARSERESGAIAAQAQADQQAYETGAARRAAQDREADRAAIAARERASQAEARARREAFDVLEWTRTAGVPVNEAGQLLVSSEGLSVTWRSRQSYSEGRMGIVAEFCNSSSDAWEGGMRLTHIPPDRGHLTLRVPANDCVEREEIIPTSAETIYIYLNEY